MSESPDTFITTVEDTGKRLDVYLADRIEGWSRARLQRLIENEDVLVNERKVKPSYKLRENDEVEIDLVEASAARFEPENIPLDIVFEDEYLAVINKPAGMVVHPGAGVQNGTLANAISFHFGFGILDFGLENDEQSKIQDLKSKIGLVHRLDKDTSGLIVVAKSDEIHEALSEQFRERTVYKSYVALVHGQIDKNSGKIEVPIGRNKHNRLRMKIDTNGRTALTLWSVRKRYDKFTLLDLEIKTGRTHQIRVHTAYINHPVVGDSIYNEGRDNTIANQEIKKAVTGLGRFFLHAERISFTHPKTKGRLEFTQPLPSELSELLLILRH